jgi:peptide/nickel transport system substrate-binding protein
MTQRSGCRHTFCTRLIIGLFPAGTPFANDAGIEVLRGPRNYAAVRQAPTHACHNGEKIVVVAPTDVQPIRALSLAGTDQLRRGGMNVDLQEMEIDASLRKRQNQPAPDQGGWNAVFGLSDRSFPNTNPYGNYWIRADAPAAWLGWPTSPRIEDLRAVCLNAGDSDEQRRIAPRCRCSCGRMSPTFRWRILAGWVLGEMV